MSKLILYGIEGSPPVRTCLLTLKALDLPFELKNVNLLEGEHLSEAYRKKNPQHTVPTLEDDDHILWDSHAIVAYLVDKYGKDDSLYPKDLLKRALVNQRLYFESGAVFHGALRSITTPMFFAKKTLVPQERIDAIAQVYGFLEAFLQPGPYVAGSQLTVADFSLVTSITSLTVFLEIDAAKYPKVTEWLKLMEALPYYAEANGQGLQRMKELFLSINFKIVP